MLDIIFSRMESACGGGVGGEEGEEGGKGGKVVDEVVKRLMGEVFENLGLFQGEKEAEEGDEKKEVKENGPVAGLAPPKRKSTKHLPSSASSPSTLSSPPLQNGKKDPMYPFSLPSCRSPSPPPSAPSPSPSVGIAAEIMVLPVPDIHLNDDPEVVFHDCFLIFRALCKLSTKEVFYFSIFFFPKKI